jgi:hypothetical protein
MSSTLSSTISTTVQNVINYIFSGLQYIAQGLVDFIQNNYDLVGLLVGFGILLVPLIKRLLGGSGIGNIFSFFGGLF